MVLPHYMGRTGEIDIKIEQNTEDSENNTETRNSHSSPTLLQAIPLLLPQEAVQPNDETYSHEKLNNHAEQHVSCESFLINCMKRKPGSRLQNTQLRSFVDDVEDQSDVCIDRGISVADEHQQTFEESDTDDLVSGGLRQAGPRIPCQCQVLRSASQWSAGLSQTEDSIHKAYCLLIERAEHFVYIENQFFISGLSGDEVIQNRILDALYKRILLAHKEQKCFRVVVVIPLLPGFQGGFDDGGAATVRAITHWQYRTISREKTSILHHLKILLGDKVYDYISFYGLRSHGRLFEGGPVATSQVYVHSKVMIVDDRVAFVGSSNINDRSLLGSRHSEIGVIIEDKEFVESSMNGEQWKAGKFSHSLRCSLWAEHLGLNDGEICQIKDPISDATYKDLWVSIAKENNDIYDDVFACIPNDNIHSRSALRQSTEHWKEKNGHTTIDLGIAPEKLDCKDGQTEGMDPMEKLGSIRGHLVTFPLEFMSLESDLRPVFNEGEFYAGPQVFH